MCYWAIKKKVQRKIKWKANEIEYTENPRTKLKQEKWTNDDQMEFPHFVFGAVLFCERLWHASFLGSWELYRSWRLYELLMMIYDYVKVFDVLIFVYMSGSGIISQTRDTFIVLICNAIYDEYFVFWSLALLIKSLIHSIPWD